MIQAPRDRSSPLPGPGTSPGAFMPSSPPIPMQTLFPAGLANTHLPVDEGTKKSLAWKYEGYKKFSEWMASDNDLFVFRRFESLNAGTILFLQDRISRLESELDTIHKEIEDSDLGDNLKNSSFRWDEQYQQRRYTIMSELSCLLLHYNQYIETFSKMRARPRAERHQIDNVDNWLKRRAITKDECDFVQHRSDLVSIDSRARPPLGQWLEACRALHLWKIFRAKFVDGLHIKSAATTYSSDQTFERFTTICIILTGLIMLLAPMWWLEYVSSSKTRLKIITGFICVFITAMTTATINRPFEVVASTAAYAAVLMVFMQIGGTT